MKKPKNHDRGDATRQPADTVATPRPARPVREQMPASQRPTMRDVATAAGVSTATVSNVLHGLRFVGPEKRQRVLDAIASLRYSPNRVAASLRSRRSHMIGIVVPDITTSFFSAVVRRIEELAGGSNYQVLLAESQENLERERERIQALIARQTDGLFVVPCIDQSPALDDIRRSGIPTVIFDRVAADTDFDSIAVDNINASREGTRHLLALGHRNIVFLASDPGLRNIAERTEGYRLALQDAGHGAMERVVVSGDTANDGERAMRAVLAGPDRPSAVFTSTHILAMGALRAIWSAGLQIPQSISLLTFDESVWMTALRPFLSVIHQPVEQIAQQAWATMVERLAGRSSPTILRDLACSLIARESTGRCPPKTD
jgi:LacI family transcriptional regulator